MVNSLRRHIMQQVSGGGGGLPAEYQQVEYIEKTAIGSKIGSIFVSHDIGEYKIETKIKLITSSYGEGYLYTDGYNGYGGIGLFVSSQSKLYVISGWTIKEVMPVADGDELNVIEENNSITVNTTTVSKSYLYYRDYGLMPFSTQFAEYTDFRMYYFKLTNNGVLVRDLVPCYRKADNVAGMYDIVNDNFYAGTGSFVVGQDVN